MPPLPAHRSRIEHTLIIGLIFLASGTVKGTFGIGLPVVAIGLLSQIIEPRLAIALVVMPIVLSNAWQVFRAGQAWLTVKRYWLLAVSCIVVIGITARFSGIVSAQALSLLIGVVIILFSVLNLTFELPAIPARYARVAQLVTGIACGVMGGLTAIWSPPLVVYLMTAKVHKDEFVRVTGLIFFLGSLPLLAGYWQSGVTNLTITLQSSLMIVPTILGFMLGEQIRRTMDAQRFRRYVLVVFLLLGLNLIRKSLIG